MFKVYFEYASGLKDYLDEFPTRAEAEAYKANSVEREGWDQDDEEAEQYVIEEHHA